MCPTLQNELPKPYCIIMRATSLIVVMWHNAKVHNNIQVIVKEGGVGNLLGGIRGVSRGYPFSIGNSA